MFACIFTPATGKNNRKCTLKLKLLLISTENVLSQQFRLMFYMLKSLYLSCTLTGQGKIFEVFEVKSPLLEDST